MKIKLACVLCVAIFCVVVIEGAEVERGVQEIGIVERGPDGIEVESGVQRVAAGGQPQAVGPSGRPQGVGPSGRPQGVGAGGQPQAVGPSGRPQGVGPSGRPQGVAAGGQPQAVGPSGRPQGVGPSGRPQGVGAGGQPQRVGPSGPPHGGAPGLGGRPQAIGVGVPVPNGVNGLKKKSSLSNKFAKLKKAAKTGYDMARSSIIFEKKVVSYEQQLVKMKNSEQPVDRHQLNAFYKSLSDEGSLTVSQIVKDFIPQNLLPVPEAGKRIAERDMWLFDLYLRLIEATTSTVQDLQILIGYVFHLADTSQNKDFEDNVHKCIVKISSSHNPVQPLSEFELCFIDDGLRYLHSGMKQEGCDKKAVNSNLNLMYPSYSRANIMSAIFLYIKLLDRKKILKSPRLPNITKSIMGIRSICVSNHLEAVIPPIDNFISRNNINQKKA